MSNRHFQTVLKLIAIVVIAVILWGFVVWVDPWITNTSSAMTQGLNVAPVLMVFFFLFAWTARPAPALLMTLALIGLIFYINHIKWIELSQPLMLSDWLLAGQVIDHFDLLSSYLNLGMLLWLGIALIIGVSWLWITEPRWLEIKGKASLAIIGLSLFIFMASPMGLAWYQNHSGPKRPWAPIHNIENQGWLAYAVSAAHTELVAMPDVDWEGIAELKAGLEAKPQLIEDTSKLPNIVVVLSESFFEPRYLKGADLCELLPDWCRLLDEGDWGEMSVPTFGGNTTRTEYEVLTGIPYRTLPQGIYPYTSVVLQPTASLAWWLKSLGYQTTAIHPHDRYFWQRHRAMPLLGFDTFIGEQEFGPHKRSGFWISDHDLTQRVMGRLDEDTTVPQFVFAISMENHGPWHGKRPNVDEQRRAALPTIEGLEERASHAYRNYLYHQRKAIRALSDLWHHAKQAERPTVILFFGDHLPGLHETFEQAGLREGFTPLTHPVPYLLLSTAPRQPQDWQPVASHQLGTWLLQQVGLPLPVAYELLAQAPPESPEKLELVYPYLMNLDPEIWSTESCRHLSFNC